MSDIVQLRVKTVDDPETYKDVGYGTLCFPLPVEENDSPPTDTSKNNPSFAITRNVSNYITVIVMTIGATTYTKTITRDVNNYITAIGKWI